MGLILVAMLGCSEDALESSYFPNKVGYSWDYTVFDSVSNKAGSLKISIIGKKTINKINSSVWLLTYSNRTDTFFVGESKDTVIFSSNNNSPRRIYIVPFALNRMWNESSFPSSNSKVIGIEDVSVEAGNFTNTYFIERTIRSMDYYLHEKIYFKPQIGIVKLYSREYDFGFSQIKTWELKDYKQ